MTLLATIPIAVCFAFVSHKKRQFDREWESAEYLMSETGAEVGIRDFGRNQSRPTIQWDKLIYGEYFSTVYHVRFFGMPVDQEAWDAVCGLSQLRFLDLYGGDQIEIKPGTFAKLNHLESLSINYCDLPTGALQGIDQVSGLESVDLSRIGPAGNDAADHVSRAGELRSLQLSEMPVSSSAIKRLCESDSLEVLKLSDCDIDFSEMLPFANVRSLIICKSTISAETLHAICRSPKIKHLSLNGCDVDLAGFPGFGEMEQLVALELNGVSVTNSHLQDIAELKDLKQLKLGETEITDAALVNLSSLDHLEELDLHNTEVSDTGVQFLTEIPSLKKLVLRRTAISNQSLYTVSSMKDLVKLDVRSTAISDDGFLALQGTKLQELDICGTDTTEQALRNLGQAPELSVNISCTKMTELNEWLNKAGRSSAWGTLYPPYQVKIESGWTQHQLYRDEPIPYCYAGDCSCKEKDDKASD